MIPGAFREGGDEGLLSYVSDGNSIMTSTTPTTPILGTEEERQRQETAAVVVVNAMEKISAEVVSLMENINTQDPNTTTTSPQDDDQDQQSFDPTAIITGQRITNNRLLCGIGALILVISAAAVLVIVLSSIATKKSPLSSPTNEVYQPSRSTLWTWVPPKEFLFSRLTLTLWRDDVALPPPS